MAAEKEEVRKKLQVTDRLQKREEERLHSIQQRNIVKEAETTIHVCCLKCYSLNQGGGGGAVEECPTTSSSSSSFIFR